MTFPYFTLVTVTLPAGQTLHAWTSGLTAGCDPVMHVLWQYSSAVWSQVAYSNDFNGLNPDATYTNTGTSSKTISIVLRARIASTGGSAVLHVQNAGQYVAGYPAIAQVGATLVSSSYFPLGTTSLPELLYAVPLPGGTNRPVVMPFVGAPGNYTTASKPFLSGGAGFAVAGETKLTHAGFLFGTPCSTPVWVFPSNRISCSYNKYSSLAAVYVNDAYSDIDGDGLGSGLEDEVGTCETLVGCYPGTKNPKDTDRDALWDSEELLGLIGPTYGTVKEPDLEFPKWGANPMHKDMFIEMDYWAYDPANVGVSVLETPTDAAEFTADIVEAFGSDTPTPPSGTVLRNPDGLPGIDAHFDLGIPMDGASTSTAYGDYPSNSSRFAAAGKYWKIDERYLGLVLLTDGTVTSGILNAANYLTRPALADAIVLMANQMNLASPPPSTSFAATRYGDPDEDVFVSIEPTDPLGNLGPLELLCSEAGAPWGPCPKEYFRQQKFLQAAFADHMSDSTYVDPLRRYRFRYVVAHDVPHDGLGGGRLVSLHLFKSDTTGTTEPQDTLAHELGHTLGLTHAGRPQWGGCGNCSPNYSSLMNYAEPFSLLYSGFSDGLQEDQFLLDPSESEELTLVPQDLGDILVSQWWNFPVFPYYVDWNRNGVYQSAATQSVAFMAWRSRCAAFAQGKQSLQNDLDVGGTIDIVRNPSGQRVEVFYPEADGTIHYFAAPLGAKLNSSCTGSPEGQADDCLAFPSSPLALDVATSAAGLSVRYLGRDLYVAMKRLSDNTLEIRKYQYVANLQVFTLLQTWNFPYLISTTPELGIVLKANNSRPLTVVFNTVIYAGNPPTPLYFYYSMELVSGVWSTPTALLDENSIPYYGEGFPTLVSWPDDDNGLAPEHKGDGRTCALLPEGPMTKLACYEPLTGRWDNITDVSFPESDWVGCPPGTVAYPPSPDGVCVPKAEGKMELSFVPSRDADANETNKDHGEGYFQLVYLLLTWDPADVEDTELLAPYAWISETVRSPDRLPGTSGCALFHGSKSERTNDWFFDAYTTLRAGLNLAAYGDPSMGGLMAAAVFGEAGGKLRFFPHADGTPVSPFLPGSDYESMEDYLCRALAQDPNFCGEVDL